MAFVSSNPAHAGVNVNQYQQGSVRPNRVDLGEEQHPTRQDYDAAVAPDEQKRRKREVSDSLSEAAAEKRKIERETREKERREKERDEKIKRDEEDKKKKKLEAEAKKQETHRKHQINELKQGLELPKYGMGRISSGPKQLASGNLLGKGVNFSTQLSTFNPASIGSFNKNKFASGRMRVNFPKVRVTQTRGYKDPLAGMNPFGHMKKRPGRKPKRNTFSLGLFRW